MAGPGGQAQRTDAITPNRSAESSASLKEQVIVAGFPDETPEVHVASLLPERGLLLLREASIRGGGSVSLGEEHSVLLADVASIDIDDAAVALLGQEGQLLVQLHLETPEDQRAWAEGLKAAIGSSSAPEDTDDGDAHMLQARSRQLQNKIGKLEAISDRRDSQLQKMLSRLDGAMRMMDAVQDMCVQQKRVIDAQTVAISELQQECGEGSSDIPLPVKTIQDVAGKKEKYDIREDHSDVDGAPNENQMAALLQVLLQESDDMPRAHQKKEPPTSTKNGATDQPDEVTQEALTRLSSLETEKERYEGLLKDSQQEHMELLSKLNQMQSLMSALGVQDPEE